MKEPWWKKGGFGGFLGGGLVGNLVGKGLFITFAVEYSKIG